MLSRQHGTGGFRRLSRTEQPDLTALVVAPVGKQPLSLEAFQFRDMRSDQPIPERVERNAVQPMRKFNANLNDEKCNTVETEHLQPNIKTYSSFVADELSEMESRKSNKGIVEANLLPSSTASRKEFLSSLNPPAAMARPSSSTGKRSASVLHQDDHERLTRELDRAMAAMDEQLNKERHPKSVTPEHPHLRTRDRGFARDIATSFTATSVGGTLILFALMSPPLSLFARPVTAPTSAVERPAIQRTDQIARSGAIAPPAEIERRAGLANGNAKLFESGPSPSRQDLFEFEPAAAEVPSLATGNTPQELRFAAPSLATIGPVVVPVPGSKQSTEQLKSTAIRPVQAHAPPNALKLTLEGWATEAALQRPLTEGLAQGGNSLSTSNGGSTVRTGRVESAASTSQSVSSVQQKPTMQFLGAPADAIVDPNETDHANGAGAYSGALSEGDRATHGSAKTNQLPSGKRRLVALPQKSVAAAPKPAAAPLSVTSAAVGSSAWRENVFSPDRN